MMCSLGKVTSENVLNFWLFNPILLDEVIVDMIFLLNTDYMLTLDHFNFEINISKQIILCFSIRMSYISTTRKDLYMRIQHS